MLKARERKGVAVGKDKYILFCARFAATVENKNKKKKKELFRYLFVFLTIYLKYFEGEFWWAKGLRVRKECYARASRRVTMESRLLWIQLQIWKQKVISVAIFELVIQFTFNVPFELNFG